MWLLIGKTHALQNREQTWCVNWPVQRCPSQLHCKKEEMKWWIEKNGGHGPKENSMEKINERQMNANGVKLWNTDPDRTFRVLVVRPRQSLIVWVCDLTAWIELNLGQSVASKRWVKKTRQKGEASLRRTHGKTSCRSKMAKKFSSPTKTSSQLIDRQHRKSRIKLKTLEMFSVVGVQSVATAAVAVCMCVGFQ